MSDWRPAGIDASVLVQAKQTEVFARLRDIVVTDINPNTIHTKVCEKNRCDSSLLFMFMMTTAELLGRFHYKVSVLQQYQYYCYLSVHVNAVMGFMR